MSDQSFIIEIKTHANLQEVKQLQQTLKEAATAAEAMGQSTEHLEKELLKVDAALGSESAKVLQLAANYQSLANVQQAMSRSSGQSALASAAAAGGPAGPPGAPGTVGGGFKAGLGEQALHLVEDGLKNVIEAYASYEEHVNRLNAALSQQGNFSQGYSKQLQEMAREMQRSAGESTDKWLNVLARLSEFGADESNIRKYADAVKNLAGIYGSTETATTAFTKAMEGNFQTFARHGIYVDEAGTQVEKMDSLMSQLAQRGGGILEARMKGLNGEWETFKGNLNDMFVGMGKIITQNENFSHGLEFVNDFMEAWGEKLRGGTLELEGFKNANVKASEAVHTHADAQRKLKKDMEELKETAHATTKEFELMKDAIRESHQADDGLAHKQMAKELADIKLMAAEHIITKEEELQAIANIEDKYERLATERKIRAAQEESQLADQKLAIELARQKDIEDKLATAKAGQKDDGEIVKQQGRELAAKNAVDTAKAEKASLEKEFAAWQAEHGSENPATKTAPEYASYQAAISDADLRVKQSEKLAAHESTRTRQGQIDLEADKERVRELEKEHEAQKKITTEARYGAYGAAQKAGFTTESLNDQQDLSSETRKEHYEAAAWKAREDEAKRTTPSFGKGGKFELRPTGPAPGYTPLNEDTHPLIQENAKQAAAIHQAKNELLKESQLNHAAHMLMAKELAEELKKQRREIEQERHKARHNRP